MYGEFGVLLLIEKPVAPLCADRVAEVVDSPATVPQVPLEVVQYSKAIDPTLPAVGKVKAKMWLAVVLTWEVLKVKLRLVIWAAETLLGAKPITAIKTEASMPKAAPSQTRTLPFTLMNKYYHEL